MNQLYDVREHISKVWNEDQIGEKELWLSEGQRRRLGISLAFLAGKLSHNYTTAQTHTQTHTLNAGIIDK